MTDPSEALAKTGRWLTRDPARERSGREIYVFVGNGPIHRWDKLGLKKNSHDPTEDDFDLPPVVSGYQSDTKVSVKVTPNSLCRDAPSSPNVLISVTYQFAANSGHEDHSGDGEVYVDGGGPFPILFQGQDVPIFLDTYTFTTVHAEPQCPNAKVKGTTCLAFVYKPFISGVTGDNGVFNTFKVSWSYTCRCDCSYGGDFNTTVDANFAPPDQGGLPCLCQ